MDRKRKEEGGGVLNTKYSSAQVYLFHRYHNFF